MANSVKFLLFFLRIIMSGLPGQMWQINSHAQNHEQRKFPGLSLAEFD
jgi:hypothetical protein